MGQNDALSKIHKSTGYKYYCFDHLYPREANKVYRKGSLYVFNIRSIDDKFISQLKEEMTSIESDEIKVIAVEMKSFNYRHIAELYTVTPSLATFDNLHWVNGDGLEKLKNRINENLIQKYNKYFNEEIPGDTDMVEMIELKNRGPIGVKYKDVTLRGNKFSIKIRSDEQAQKLAFIGMAMGILEKSSAAGMGYCIATYT